MNRKKILSYQSRYYNADRQYSYSGHLKRLLKKKEKKSNFEKWLESQPAWTLHRPIIRQYKRRRIIAAGINHIWEIDLIDLIRLKKYNSGMSYLLVVIDIFSKKVDIIPIKNKTSSSIIEAFKFLLGPEGRTWGRFGQKPYLLRSDKGGEFLGKKFIQYLNQNGMYHYTAENPDTKSATVERVIRSIRQRLYRYLTQKNTKRVIDIIPRLVESYNKSYHTSIRMRPIDVTLKNQYLVRENLYGTPDLLSSFQTNRQLPQNRSLRQANDNDLKIGDYVRISKYKSILSRKGYSPNFTTEIFRIISIDRGIKGNKRALFTLVDQNSEILEGGRFYREELSRVNNG